MPCSLSSGGISTAQACEIISRVSCVGSIDLVDWKQLEQEKYICKIKGEKRNGALSRQQAFGKLFKR